jgi:hypothetical protein
VVGFVIIPKIMTTVNWHHDIAWFDDTRTRKCQLATRTMSLMPRPHATFVPAKGALIFRIFRSTSPLKRMIID